MSGALSVVRPGMLTTVQDLGRRGYQGLGVPVAGPMDWFSHRLANLCAGNHPMAAALEVTLIGPELIAEADAICAVAGADFDVQVDGQAVASTEPLVLRQGARIRLGVRRLGARATLAVRGGFDLPPTFGSRATHIVSRMGPFGGRALVAGDRLPIGGAIAGPARASGAPLAMPRGGARVRVMAGPHRGRFTERGWASLVSTRFTVTPQSNRMGYRLEGATVEHVRAADILSEPTPMGALQVPASGQPIVLMADRQTTGGYAVIATIITADLPVAGQLAPGDWIEFSSCGRDEALSALRDREAALREKPRVP